jgi:phage shock protein PspC (stress-responsive transcriptional regulator)
MTMQKVISINLNGNAYQLEENGYNLLTAYLERAESQLRDNPDKAEVIADLEQAIADKCRDCLGPHKTVVSGDDTARILNEMGPVDAPAGEGDSAHAEPGGASIAGDEAGDKTGAGAAPKRLYLIREGAMIGGVCKGFAAYLNIDVTIVRLIFVALVAVTYGGWIFAYFVMMFIIPPANTSEERAAAFGLPFSAQDLIDQAKKNYAGMKNNKEWKRNWRQQRHQWKQWRRTMRERAYMWDPAMHEPVDHAARVLSGIMASIFGVVILALFVLMGLGIFSLVKTGAIGGWALPAGIPLWAGIVGLVLLFQALSSPFHAGYHTGRYSSRYRYGHRHDVYSALGGLIWMMLIAFGVWYGYHHVPAIHDFIESLPGIWRDMQHLLSNHRAA